MHAKRIGMKRLMFTVMAVGLLMACGGGSTDTMRRLQQAEDVVEEHPDSAAGLLSQVVTTGMTEEETALYGLLWTMAEYKKANYSINDSLISRSIDYYDRHGDKWHRTSAYYYRGGVKRHMMKNVPEAIKDYKTAEGLAEGLDDWQLKSKIDEQLAFTNYFSQNVVLTLEYSQKFLRDARMLNDSSMVVRAHQMVASSYEQLDEKDSAFVYLLRGLQWIDGADERTRSNMMAAVADMYQQQKDLQRAEQYLTDEVLSRSLNKTGTLTLADIRMAQGRMDEAESLLKNALQEMKQAMYQMLVCSHLAQLYEKRGDYERAYAMRLRHDEISDSLVKANDSQCMAQWQQQYDEERQAKEFYRRTSWMLGLIIALAVVVALSIAVGTWWHRRKVRRLSFRLDEDARRISELRTKIELLEKSGAENGQEIARLKEELESRMERISGTLLIGTQMFSQLQQRQCIAEATAKEQQCLVDYFAQLRPKRWQEWERKYSGLSTAQYIFLIMQDDLHFDDEAIAAALAVKRTSVRSMRSRIKGRER